MVDGGGKGCACKIDFDFDFEIACLHFWRCLCIVCATLYRAREVG